MKKLIIIKGDLASGKTTFSKILSKKYGISVFNKDILKEILGDEIGYSNREENLKLSRAAVEIMIHNLKEFIKLEKPIILESNFHKNELDKIFSIAEKEGYKVLVLNLIGDLNILYERFLKRIVNENRHHVHLTTTLDKKDEFISYVTRSRYDYDAKNIIEINASDFSYQNDEIILNKIDLFINSWFT